ncbi:helix-turn-helix transcriptional regulator [Mycoplasma sp. P36-A1]|uniref:helix-turn-helix transcriptional regulator n=1 Tax=Mycoplasma sp. P36-A1 TaxID=3252900 RepID=UPI003C2B2CA3
MICNNLEEYYEAFFSKINYIQYKNEHFNLYINPSKSEEYIIHAKIFDWYELFVGDFTIYEDIMIDYDIGETYLHLEMFLGQEDNSNQNSYSSFLLYGKDRKGRQKWQKNSHYHSTDIIIKKPFFEKKLVDYDYTFNELDYYGLNKLFKPLPVQVLHILQEISTTISHKKVSRLYLDAQIMNIIYFLIPKDNISAVQSKTIPLEMKNGKRVILSATDHEIIQQIHNEITLNCGNYLTIKQLADKYYIGVQKLTYGFKYLYHMSIHDYISLVKINLANSMLVAENAKISVIAKTLGFANSNSFIYFYKSKMKITPKQFQIKSR